METTMKAGLIGCGDYLRWEIDKLNHSKLLKLKLTYDLDPEKAKAIAMQTGAVAAGSEDEIFNDKEISIVLIYTPPWARTELFRKAVAAGKHIITTKPLGTNAAGARELAAIVGEKVHCSVFYGRAGDAATETLKGIFEGGEIGHLALYKEDWFHHYPHWNDWATDPEKNGGPFMDAMIHNLNRSRYLSGSPVASATFVSDNYVQNLKCNDTEFMRVRFMNGSAAWLFITWAADLEIFDPAGNDREHLGIQHMITSEGWYVAEEEIGKKQFIVARKEGKSKKWEVAPLADTPYDEVARAIQDNKKSGHDISLALDDMEVMEQARAGLPGGVS